MLFRSAGITDDRWAGVSLLAPFILDPNNPNTMLAGGQRLWRSTNIKAATPDWSPIKPTVVSGITAISVAPHNSDRCWAGFAYGILTTTANCTALARMD